MIKKEHNFNILIILLVSFFVYFASLFNQFVWDDEIQIVGNTIIHSLTNFPLLFTKGIVYTPGQSLSGGFYRPVLTLSYMLLWTISSSPFIFRLFQVFIHCLNSVLVYLIFFELFAKKRLAFFSSLFFAVAPAISEGVLFIAGLGEPLFSFFLLSSFFLHLKGKTVWPLFLFFLSLLTKETAVVFLPLIFFYHFLFLRNKRSVIVKTAPFCIPFFVYFLLRVAVVGWVNGNLNFPAPIAQASLSSRLLTIPLEITSYLKLLIFPFNLAISQHFLVISPADYRFWLALLTISLLMVASFFTYRKIKSRLFLFFSGWFLLFLIPAVNLIPLSATIAERWLYFPAIGAIGAVISIYSVLKLQTRTRRRVLSIIAVFVLIIWTGRTFLRNLDWQNGYTLYRHDLRINPESFELQNNFGVELFRRGEIEKARGYFERSITLAPNWWTNYNNLGVVLENQKDNQKALELYQKAIDNGNYYLAFENVGRLYLKMNNYSACRDFLNKIMPFFPQNANLYNYLATCLYKLGDYNNALKAAKNAFNLNPSQNNRNLFQTIVNKRTLE